ncbi:unnamed protein product, partial [Haemonchus placei]|uniref:7TM_GPCR_Srx domain-containing protein n=1 Tax=Haemonchus placei TaxID=6290 RepID=A0A0N4X1U1_HAEPC
RKLARCVEKGKTLTSSRNPLVILFFEAFEAFSFFYLQAIVQGSIFLCGMISFYFICQLFTDRWADFITMTIPWESCHHGFLWEVHFSSW